MRVKEIWTIRAIGQSDIYDEDDEEGNEVVFLRANLVRPDVEPSLPLRHREQRWSQGSANGVTKRRARGYAGASERKRSGNAPHSTAEA